MATPEEDIKWLARRCAQAGLKLKPSRDLFNALYVADALILNKGNMTAAARSARAGDAATLRRALKRAGTDQLPEDDT